jgi:hypothetical protein
MDSIFFGPGDTAITVTGAGRVQSAGPYAYSSLHIECMPASVADRGAGSDRHTLGRHVCPYIPLVANDVMPGMPMPSKTVRMPHRTWETLDGLVVTAAHDTRIGVPM